MFFIAIEVIFFSIARDITRCCFCRCVCNFDPLGSLIAVIVILDVCDYSCREVGDAYSVVDCRVVLIVVLLFLIIPMMEISLSVRSTFIKSMHLCFFQDQLTFISDLFFFR